MAIIKISIEDIPDGKIKIVTDPPLESVIHMELSGHEIPPSLGMAFKILNDIRKESKRNSPTLIQIPKLN